MPELYSCVQEVIQQQALQISYQPIINHYQQRVVGFEALSRPHYKNELIAPDVWFASALECGMYIDADLAAIRCAVQGYAGEMKTKSSPFLFVNVLPDTLVDERFPSGIAAILREVEFDPSKIVLEIVESTVYDVSTVASAANLMKDLGLHIALDDMGVGGSNLRSLIDLEPDFVKVDKSLIQGIAHSDNKRKMLSLVSQYASAGSVIAEGIENLEDLMAVQDTGVALSQGYYWSKPMTADRIRRFRPFSPADHAVLVQANQGDGLRRLERIVKWIKGDKETADSKQSEYSNIDITRATSSETVTLVDTDTPKSVDGVASVVDGKIVITDPVNTGFYPVIVVPNNNGIVVTINSRSAVGECVVTSSDSIYVQFMNKEPCVKYTTSVSADRMQVTVQADVQIGAAFRLSDSGPSRKLMLHVAKDDVYPEYDPSARAQGILDSLTEQGLHGQIDYESISELCHTTTSCDRVVLVGTLPVSGKPAHYKRITVPKEIDRFTGRVHLSTVVTGQCIAVYEPEIQGIPGRDVYDQEVLVSTPSLKPLFGEGVIEVNGNIVAKRSGRVIFTKRIIDVMPELVIDHNVTVRDGKITFDGNVIVRGNVEDGSYIQANGTITISGNVFQATVIGETGVYVSGNIVHSSIWGGFTQIAKKETVVALKDLHLKLDKFYKEYSVMLDHVVNRVNAKLILPRISSTMFELRHQNLAMLLENLATDHSEELILVDDAYQELITLIRAKWHGVQRTSVTLEDTLQLMNLLDEYFRRLESALATEPATVRVNSVTSGVIRATGHIRIAAGTYASSIESGKSVTVDCDVRGGFVVAEKAVRLRELGSQSGAETSVRVLSPDGSVKIGVAHTNTLIEVAGERYRNDTTKRNVSYGRKQLASKRVSNGRLH